MTADRQRGLSDATVRCDGGADRPGLDDLLGLLGDRHRRQVLYELRDADDVVSIDDLSRRVAAREADCAPEAVPEEMREHFAARLHHRDLPKLADLHLVEFDPRSGDVVPGEGFDRLRSYLELAEREEAKEEDRKD